MCEGYVNPTRVLNVWLNEHGNISKYWRNKNTTFNSKSSQNLFFSCYISETSALPITKSGALYVCEGYVNITRVLNVWLNEQSNISKYQRNKNTTFNTEGIQSLFFAF